MTFCSYLVHDRKYLSYRSTASSDSSSHDNRPFLLHAESLLALFIYEQVHSLGTIRTRQSARLRLVEPLSITDDFSTWSYDHFRGLFEIELRPHLDRSFPTSWLLAKNAHISCQFVYNGTRQTNETATPLVLDRPRTGSLEQFVYDVFAKEDMQAERWLKALQGEDILTFAHLSNLKQTEWSNIKGLPMHPKKMLQTAVDRERESVADDRRRSFEESTSSEDFSQSTGISRKESRC